MPATTAGPRCELERVMRAQGYTVARLAHELNDLLPEPVVSSNLIYQYFTGRKVPGPDRRALIAQVLDVDAGELFPPADLARRRPPTAAAA